MDEQQSKFEILFTKYVTQVLEMIFFCLDYTSFKICLEVSTTGKELLTTESYQDKGKSLFHDEILEDKEKLVYRTSKSLHQSGLLT